MDRLEEIERQIKRAENASDYAEANALLANTKYLLSRLKAAEAVVEAARRVDRDLSVMVQNVSKWPVSAQHLVNHGDLTKGLAAYDKLKGES